MTRGVEVHGVTVHGTQSNGTRHTAPLLDLSWHTAMEDEAHSTQRSPCRGAAARVQTSRPHGLFAQPAIQ